MCSKTMHPQVCYQAQHSIHGTSGCIHHITTAGFRRQRPHRPYMDQHGRLVTHRQPLLKPNCRQQEPESCLGRHMNLTQALVIISKSCVGTRGTLHTIQILRYFNFVEFCSTYWATIRSLHPRLQTAIVKVVAAWEQVCYKLLIIGANRGLPIGQLGFDSKVEF